MESKTKKGKSRLQVLLFIIVIILITFGIFRRCSTSSSTLSDDFRRPGTDTISVAIELSPLTYSFRHDTAGGFDYEMLRAIGRKHNVAFSFHPVSDLDRAFRGLSDGRYDMLVASMPATSELKKYFALTDPIYIDRQVLVQRRSDDSSVSVDSHRRLLEDTVYIPDGAPYRSRLRNLSAELGGNINYKSVPGYSAEHLAIMTALGNIPHAVLSEKIARKVAAEYPHLDISLPISLNQFQVWAVAPGDSSLLDSVNSWISDFRLTSAYDSLASHYIVDKVDKQ